MTDSSLPVLVVDDARFSTVVITRTLQDAGFRDVRYARSGAEALDQLEERVADIIISDWIMPEMDGLELTARIRDLDEIRDHFTYVMLLSGQEELTAITHAFESGVDDFVSKSALRTHLLPRVWAACRTAGYNNTLLARHRSLREQIATLERRNMIDPLTGLGNERFTDRALSDILRQVASRGGAACMVLVGLHNYAALCAELEQAAVDALIRKVGQRLEGLVRPLDVVTRLSPDCFAILMHQPGVGNCTVECFRRIHDALHEREVETDHGAAPRVEIVLAVVSADVPEGLPTADQLVHYGRTLLREAERHSGGAREGVWRASA